MALPATLPQTVQAEAALFLTHSHLSARQGLTPAQREAAVLRFRQALVAAGHVTGTESLRGTARAILSGFLGRPVTGEARAFALA